MIAYFGRDDKGYFADSENGREYLSEELWRALVQAGSKAGADVSHIEEPGHTPVKFNITEQITLKKFEGDTLIETLSI